MAVKFLSGMLRNRPDWAKLLTLFAVLWSLSSHVLLAVETDRKVLLRDITQIEGVRDNQLVG
jgi:flagellar basal body P-ring protein FlgI